MLRKIKLIAIIAATLLLMAGCNLDEKIGESITEGIIEKAVGDDIDLDVDGEDFTYKSEEGEITFDEEEGVTFEGEDGEVVAAGGEYDWPEDQAAKYLPKLDSGKISYIYNSTDSCMLILDEVTKEDYEAYVKAVSDDGYTNEKVESFAEDMSLYSGQTEEGIAVTVCFFNSETSMQINVDATGISE